MSKELESLKTYVELYEYYENESICLDEKRLNSANSFMFLNDYLFKFCRGGFRFGFFGFPLDKNGKVFGSLSTYIKFKWAIRGAKKYVKKHIKSHDISKKALAEILKREIEIMKKRFVFTKYDVSWAAIEKPFLDKP